MRINKNEAKQFILIILAVFIWIPPYEWAQKYFNWIIGFRVVLAIYYLCITLMQGRINDKPVVWVFMYMFVAALSSMLNGDVKLALQALVDPLMYISMFLLLCRSFRSSRRVTYHALLSILTIYVVLTAIQFDSISLSLNVELMDTSIYVIGGKFDTCYLFMIWYYLILEISNEKNIKFRKIIFGIIILLLSAQTGCITGMIGILFSFLLQLVPEDKFRKITPMKIVLILVIMDMAIFFLNGLLQVPVITYFIENVLGKDAGLTGRLKIYSRLKSLISNKLLFGYGYGSMQIKTLIDFANTQNGLFQIVYSYGLLGAACFLKVVYSTFGEIASIPAVRKKHYRNKHGILNLLGS